MIAFAVLGTFGLASQAAKGDRSSYLVAARDLPTGTRLTNNDLALVSMSLGTSVAHNAFSDRAKVQGAVTLGPLKSGELVQGGSLIFKGSGSRPEMSFSLPAARAVGGDLRSGETVDVLVTRKNSDAVKADVAVSDATVVKTSGGLTGAARSSDVIITLALKDREEAAVLAAALDGASVTLQRTTGVGAAPVKP